jgi:phosphopantetheinyl transferase (holo-ACP synthase)
MIRVTCPKSEYLEISPEIMAFAEKILSQDEIQKAERISIALTKKATRLCAQSSLQKSLGCRPKRPIYYAWVEIDHLPRKTRFVIEYVGHFVDTMLKCMAVEKLSNSRCQEYSFGTNLTKLKDKIPTDLYSELNDYNKLIYRPAKHDWIVKDRSHRFTCKEVVFAIFITLKIKEQFISISHEVKAYCEDKIPNP